MKKLHTILGFGFVMGVATLAFAHPGKGHMKKMDTNGDGKVTLDEARAAAKQRFDRLDADKNGVVSKDEMKGKGRMRHADANNDGQVTAAEAQAKFDEWFKKKDTNKDNILTADELRKGHAKRHKGKQKNDA